MKSALLLAVILALALAVAGPATAQRPLVGAPVLDAEGRRLGAVVAVVDDAAGRPAQVLVRPEGLRPAAPKSLALAGLKLRGEALVTPLSRAEFDAIPSAPKPSS